MKGFIFLGTFLAGLPSLIQRRFPGYQLAPGRSWCILVLNRGSHTDRNLDDRTFDPEHRGFHRVVASESDSDPGGCPAISRLASAPAIWPGSTFRCLGSGGY